MSNESTLDVIDRFARSTPSRRLSVACALELIKADLTSDVLGTGNKNRLSEHMENLSEYADKIESALNKN